MLAVVPTAYLYNVTLRVFVAGQRRALREGRKNVHAWADGTVAFARPGVRWVAFTYDPFVRAAFVRVDDGRVIVAARWAKLTALGSFAAGVDYSDTLSKQIDLTREAIVPKRVQPIMTIPMTTTTETVWICSNAIGDDAPWHVAVTCERRGERTGKLFATYYVTRCTGRQLGGAYGQTKAPQPHPGGRVCARCTKLTGGAS